MHPEDEEDWTVHEEQVDKHGFHVYDKLVRVLAFFDLLLISDILVCFVGASAEVTDAKSDHNHVNGEHFSLKCLCKVAL